jgi:hypothetical protein
LHTIKSPWGSVEPGEDDDTVKERNAIGTKGVKGTMPEYVNVSDYERSQAFLIRVKNWSKPETVFSLIVKNSIFLNDNSLDFRREILDLYQINYFYELSNYNKILFKKHVIGKVGNKDIVIGATEPCAILVFENKKQENTILTYISPKLNGFSECLNVIHFTEKDNTKLEQTMFVEDDLLWRILVNGDLESYELIKKRLLIKKETTIECRSGFKATTKMKPLGDPDFRILIEPNDFKRYKIINKPKVFNYNQDMERKRRKEVFEGERLLFPNRPLKQDKYKLRCIGIYSNEIHKDNISSIRIKDNSNNILNIKPYLAFFNSKLIGFIYIQCIFSMGYWRGKKRQDQKH